MRIDRVVELGCGGAGFSLAMWASPGLPAPVGYYGGKGAYAVELRGLARLRAPFPRRFLWLDAGPWGEAWRAILGPRGNDLAEIVQQYDAGDAYGALVTERPATELDRVARWLWLQARSVNAIPVWWDDARAMWVSAARAGRSGQPREDGGWTKRARERGAFQGPGRGRNGLQYGQTIAGRIHAIRRTRVAQGIDVEIVTTPLEEWADLDTLTERDLVLFDPPYQGRQGYAVDLARPAALQVARRSAARGARMLVCEGVALDTLVAEGRWYATEVPSRARCREWVMTNFVPDQVPALQAALPFMETAKRRGKIRGLPGEDRTRPGSTRVTRASEPTRAVPLFGGLGG